MTPPPATPAIWTPRDAEKLYNMPGWGLGFFRTNADGHVTVHADMSGTDHLSSTAFTRGRIL